jgi:hypothetical protein
METPALVPLATAQAHRVTVTWKSPEVLSTQKLNHRPTINSTEYSPILEVGDHHSSWVSFHETTNSFSYLAHDSQTTETSRSCSTHCTRMQTASPLCLFIQRKIKKIYKSSTPGARWTLKADSHIACRAHAVPLIHTCHVAPLPCRAVNSHVPCRSPAMLRQCRVLRENPRGSRKYPNC